MATVLAAEVVDLTDTRRCVNTLLAAHFRCGDILECLEDAQEFARKIRAAIAEQLNARD